MSIQKMLKIAVGAILGGAFLLFAILIVHIAVMVKGRKSLENPTIQMARVDFQRSLNASEIKEIERNVKSQNGVKDIYYNPAAKILIYSFDAKINNAQKIYDVAIKSSGYKAHRFTFTKNEEANGCPAMDNHSVYGKLTNMVETVIN